MSNDLIDQAVSLGFLRGHIMIALGVQLDTERDNYMSALQAKEYGLIDEVIAHR